MKQVTAEKVANSTPNNVTIELSLNKLVELMAGGHLCGADIHTHDPEMKAMVKEACLKSCVNKVCATCDMQALCAQPIEVSSVISVMPSVRSQLN